MELTSTKIQIKHSLIDESFNADEVKHYKLFIQLGNDFLSACILDDVRKKFICLEDFRFPFSLHAEALAEKCELAKQQSKFLQLENFQLVNCCINFPKSTLIPEPLYDIQYENLLIAFNFGESKDEIILSDDLNLIKTKNLFFIPPLIQKMLHYWFHDILIHHQSTVFINSLLISNKYRQEKTVTINVRQSDFDLAVTTGSKLIFYNCFQYKTSEDFLYFILFTIEQLQLNPETVEVKLAGDTDRHSALYKSISRYLQNVSFIEQHHSYNYSYKFDSLLPAAYYTLFNQHRCES